MKLNDLKSDWKNAGKNFKSEADLRLMTKVINHPSIKKIRTKLIIEAIVLLFFLFIYYDWFDGDKKPFYANLSLVVGLLLYIFNDIIAYISITRPIPIRETNLKLSLQNYLMRIKRLSISSIIITFLYSISIIIFFTSVITFTKEKGIILIFSVVIAVQFILLSSRMWTKWIKNLKLQVKDFNLDDES